MPMMKTALKRAGHLGLLARDLAALRLAAPGEDRSLRSRRVAGRLGLLHGLPQKIGQMLAFSDLESGGDAFARLTEDRPALSADDAFAEMSRQIGCDIRSLVTQIDPVGISASIGQVHRAVLRDGREVAIKVQYPAIAESLEWDLKALGWLSAPVGDLRNGFSMADYRREIGAMTRRELDYRQEARSLARFAGLFADHPGVLIPSVVEELSGPHILTTSWIPGDRIHEARCWSREERRDAAEILMGAFIPGLFQWRLLHADPHPGNVRYLRTADGVRVGLIDFGCVMEPGENFVRGLAGLLDDSGAASAEARFLEMGFDRMRMSPFVDKMGAVAAALRLPFASGEPMTVAEWDLGGRLAAILGSHRMAFRTAGPPAMLYFLRAFQGMLRHLRMLDVPIRFRDLWERRASVQVSVPAGRVDLPPGGAGDSTLSTMKSQSLHIRVSEGDVTRVDLTFGAAATDCLPDLVPGELRRTLADRCIHLEDISAGARRRDYAPGDLFLYEEGDRKVRVWLA